MGAQRRELAGFLILILAVPIATVSAATEIINAKITKIAPAKRSIDVEVKGKSYSITLEVEPSAKLEINGVRANLDEFHVDMQVTLIADIKAGKVTRINAQGTKEAGKPTRRPSPKGPPTKEGADPIVARGPLPDSLKEMDDIVQEFLAAEEVRGAVVMIVKNGKGVFARSYGFADKARKTPIETTTLFPLDEGSKAITGLAIAQLAEQGKIDPNIKFFDALGVKPTADDKDVPDGSRFVDASTIDLMKNPNRFLRDPFFKEYLEDSDFRKKMNDRVKTMPDGSKVELRKFIKYDVVDLQYMLLARLVAKGTGKGYEPGVQEMLLGPAGISTAKVVLLPLEEETEERRTPVPVSPKERSRKDRLQKKKDEEKDKIKKKADLYQGVAQVQFAAGKDYETPSMSLDGAGSWVASAFDLARLVKAIDAPSETSLLKADGLKILLTPVARSTAAEDDDEKDDKETPRETKLKSARFFASGWWVVRPSSDDPEALFKSRRCFHSGPVAVCSDAGLHVVVAMTTALTASKSGEEHPLILEILDAASRVKEWPKDDFFGPSATQAEPEVAEAMPDENGSAPTAKRPRLRVPVINSIGDQVESACRDCWSAYNKFLDSGGTKLLSEIQLSSVPDLKRIAQRSPEGIAAAQTLRGEYEKVLLTRAVGLNPLVPPDKPNQRDAVQAVMSYAESISRFILHLSDSFRSGTNADESKQVVTQIRQNEERMYADLFAALEKIDAAFPSEVKAAASEAELSRSLDRIELRLKATSQKLQSFVSSRFGQIDVIQSRAGGASAEEQLQLPILVKEIQGISAQTVTSFTTLGQRATSFLEAEKAAGSNFVTVWQGVIDLATANGAYASFMATFGNDDFKPDDEQAYLDKIDAAKKSLAELRAALTDPPAEQSKDAPPAETQTPAETKGS
jgi:CubicO group peptidase (beta-lactamase class C family)